MATNTIDQNTPLGRQNRYPSPFLDISTTFLPVNIKSLFHFCRFYASGHHLVHAAIQRLAGYPITDLLIEHGEARHERNWKSLLVDQLDVRGFVKELRLDMLAYGNAFFRVHYPFRRWFECTNPECQAFTLAVHARVRVTGRGTLEGVCKACGQEGVFEFHDVPERNIRKIRLVRIDPMNIDIKYMSITGEKKYVYSIPGKDVKAIRAGDPDAMATIPAIFVQAVIKKKRVLLDSEHIFHMRRPSISGHQMEWGLPLVFPIMRLLYVTQIFLKAREAIAIEHAVPLRILHPDQGPINPAEEIDLGRWSDQILDGIQKWRRDNNHVIVAPVKVGQTFFGGDANALSVAPDLETLEKDITAGMMIPIEFLFGGLSFSGSSVSLRMLENDFLNDRSDAQRMINSFIIRNLARFLGWPECKAKFSDLRTSDDVQKQQILVQLAAAQQVSTKTLLHAFGFDAEDEMKQVLDEMELVSEILVKQAKGQAKAEGERALVGMEYSVKAQIKAQQIQEQEMALLMEQGVDPAEIDLMREKVDSSGAADMPAQLMHGYIQGGREGGGGGGGGGGAAGQNGAGGQGGDVQQAWVEELHSMDEAQRKQSLSRIRKNSPGLHDQLLEGLKTRKEVDLKPLPAQKPPRRKSSPM
jgi:hypothetical protein